MKPIKLFAFDCETTGLHEGLCGIVEMAYIIFIDGEEAHNRVLRTAPHPGDLIDQEALDVHGYTKDEILSFPQPFIFHRELLNDLGQFVDKFDKTDKFYPFAYNGKFDYGFLKNFFEKESDQYFGSWFNHRLIDPLAFVNYLAYKGKITLPDHKLKTVAGHFGVSLSAHNALSDIRAALEIFRELEKML